MNIHYALFIQFSQKIPRDSSALSKDKLVVKKIKYKVNPLNTDPNFTVNKVHVGKRGGDCYLGFTYRKKRNKSVSFLFK